MFGRVSLVHVCLNGTVSMFRTAPASIRDPGSIVDQPIRHPFSSDGCRKSWLSMRIVPTRLRSLVFALLAGDNARRDEVAYSEDTLDRLLSGKLEQSTGIAQVSEAVTQMDALTQQNATLVEEATAAPQRRAGTPAYATFDGSTTPHSERRWAEGVSRPEPRMGRVLSCACSTQ